VLAGTVARPAHHGAQGEPTSSQAIVVGIDGRVFAKPATGIGRYVGGLCQELDVVLPDARFVVYSPFEVDPPVASLRWVVSVDHRPRPLDNGYVWLKTHAGRLCARDGVDVFWASATLLPRLHPGVRTVTTVYDLVHRVAPSSMPISSRVKFGLSFRHDVRAADTVLAISQGTADRLRQHTGRAVDAVISPGVSPHFRPPSDAEVEAVRRRHRLDHAFLLGVATWEPRKNLERLVRAFVALREAGEATDHELVLVGSAGWKDRSLREVVASAGHHGVRALGYVPDEDLPALYGAAGAFIFPSLYEGFGLPVLEARACGARVVASDTPELREAGGPDTLFVEPTDEGVRAGIEAAIAGRVRPSGATTFPTWRPGAQTLADALLGTL